MARTRTEFRETESDSNVACVAAIALQQVPISVLLAADFVVLCSNP